MSKLVMVIAATGEEVDTLTLNGDTITYTTGRAKDIIESRARARGITNKQLWQHLRGWSNGYVTFREQGQSLP